MVNQDSAQSYALGCSELCNRGQSFSENRSFGVGIHDVSEKGRGAARKPSKSALKTVENVDFLSSATWNLTAKSIKPRNRKGLPKTGSSVQVYKLQVTSVQVTSVQVTSVQVYKLLSVQVYKLLSYKVYKSLNY